MENWDLYFFPIFFGILILTVIFFTTRFILKQSKRKMRISTYFGIKSAKVKFKVLDSSIMHSLFVLPKRKYEVVYSLETEEGSISLFLDNQLKIETTTRKEGSEILSFRRFQPIVSFRGKDAKNGECAIRINRKR